MSRKPKTVEEWQEFGRNFNNRARFPDLETLARFYGLKSANAIKKIWISDYENIRLKSEAALPKLVNRDKTRMYAPVPDADDLSGIGGKGKYLVTAAQFGAAPNANVIKTLKRYAKEHNATLLVLPIQYGVTYKKDKETGLYHLVTRLSTVITSDPDIKVVYAEHTDELVLSDKIWLNTSRIRPTINRPLTGFSQHGGTATQVFAHPKMDLETVPIDNDGLPKLLMTTGSCTYPYYKDEKTGRLAMEVHCWGGILIEVEDGGQFHVRQLLTNESGEFYDIDRKFYSSKETKRKSNCVDSLVLGDWHTGSTDPIVRRATFGKGGIVDQLNPLNLIIHDFIDSYSVSHHDEADATLMTYKAERGMLSLRDELNKGVEEIRFMLQNSKAVLKFVTSNHDEHVDRWLKEDRAVRKNDWYNRSIYHELSSLKLAHKLKYPRSRLHVAALYMLSKLTEKEKKRVVFIERDQTLVHPVGVGSKDQVKLDMHGDKGISGSRGNIFQFARNAMRVIVGHTHSAAIFGPVWRVGTSTLLDLGYNDGPSNWTHTHCILYENGQRQLISIVKGKWHATSQRVYMENGEIKIAA